MTAISSLRTRSSTLSTHVREPDDVVQAEQPGRPLDGVRGPEDGVDGLGRVGLRLQAEQPVLHLLQQLARLDRRRWRARRASRLRGSSHGSPRDDPGGAAGAPASSSVVRWAIARTSITAWLRSASHSRRPQLGRLPLGHQQHLQAGGVQLGDRRPGRARRSAPWAAAASSSRHAGRPSARPRSGWSARRPGRGRARSCRALTAGSASRRRPASAPAGTA